MGRSILTYKLSPPPPLSIMVRQLETFPHVMIISLCLHLSFPGRSQFFRFIPLKTGFSLSIHAKQLPPLFLIVPSDHPFLQSLIMAMGWKFASHVKLALTSFQIALPLPLLRITPMLKEMLYSCISVYSIMRGRRSKVISLCLGQSFLSTGQQYISTGNYQLT